VRIEFSSNTILDGLEFVFNECQLYFINPKT